MNYFRFANNQEMYDAAKELNGQLSIEQLKIRDFLGINKEHANRLSKLGIRTALQMIERGKIIENRKELAEKTGLSDEIILEFVKLSDLSRIGGLKRKRARLFFDAGFETVEEIARLDSEKLREKLIEYVEETNFEGTVSTASEVRFAVSLARYLPKTIEYG